MQLHASTGVAAGRHCLQLAVQVCSCMPFQSSSCRPHFHVTKHFAPFMAQAAKEAVPEVVSTLAIMKRRQRLLISAEVPLVTILCMVRCRQLCMPAIHEDRIQLCFSSYLSRI